MAVSSETGLIAMYTSSRNNYVAGVFSKLTAWALGTQARIVDFVETGLVGQTNFICLRYSVMKASRV
jgi:hypothetical protein